LRDLDKRGYTKEKILDQLNKRSLDVTKYIAPQKAFADMVVSYFTQNVFQVGDVNANAMIALKVTLDSSVKLDALIYEFSRAGICVEWDYADDLKTQYLVFFTKYITRNFGENCKNYYSIASRNRSRRYNLASRLQRYYAASYAYYFE